MLEKARAHRIGFDRFATGHYARVDYCDKSQRYRLSRGVDPKKDQSYFLYGLNQAILPALFLPLGAMTKTEVRKRAQELQLPVAERKESQDFIEGGGYDSLFEGDAIEPGPIVDAAGNRLGQHRGIVHYTIGQRRGLEIAYREPLYVLRIDAPTNTITVGPKNELFSNTVIARDLNFLSADPPAAPIPISAQIRHNHRAEEARLTLLEDGSAQVVFETPQPAITPGQAVVFYDGEVVLGGGIIDSRL
jgi:tRNA-specific 2-thiouridylase